MRPPPGSTLFPYTTLFRSPRRVRDGPRALQRAAGGVGGRAAAGDHVRAAAAEGQGRADSAGAIDRAVLGRAELGGDPRDHAVLLLDPLPAAVRSDLHELYDRGAALLADADRVRQRRRLRRLLRGRGGVRLEGRSLAGAPRPPQV